MYFEANDLDHITINGTDFQANLQDRNIAINHLNQSFLISSPLGRLVSYIKAFLGKYVEVRH